MTQQDKELLLKDLCARLPYGIKMLHKGWNYEWDDELSTIERVIGLDEHFIYTKVIDTHTGEEYRDDRHSINTFDDKLFLRPMSGMTKEEKRECFETAILYSVDANGRLHFDGFGNLNAEETVEAFDWLNAHHFDYRGLIEKSLALEAPEVMYK